MASIDLGCGLRKAEGAFGVDIAMVGGVDVVCDLEGEFPFRDGCIDTVYASHCIEHIGDTLRFMGEVNRVLAPGGRAVLTVPLAGSPNSYQADHKHFFRARDFYYYDDGNACHYYVAKAGSFMLESVRYGHGYPLWIPPLWLVGAALASVLNAAPVFLREAYENFLLTFLPMKEFTVTLEKPGTVKKPAKV